jgi:glycosyltransferase involved in cell wall biosynthesis
MRILHILNHIQEIGNGIVNAAIDIACLQAKAGQEVAVASGGGEYETLLTDYGATHFELDQTRKPLNLIRAARRYQAIIREFQPDIVHVHMITGVLLAWLLRGSAKYRLVAHIQNVHQRSSVLMGLAERAIPVSDAVADYMAKRGIPRQKMRVVQNLTLGSPRLPSIDTYLSKPLEQPAIVTVAGMYKRKGISELIQAFERVANRFPAANLYLVGNGPDLPIFKAQTAASAFAQNIHFEGFQKNPQAYMLAAHVFVLASHRESYGIVLVEARQAGCAIVASQIDGIPEALDYGKAGILVPPGDVIALAGAIEKLLQDPAEHQKWKCAAQQNLERLAATNMEEGVMTVYHDLLKSA